MTPPRRTWLVALGSALAAAGAVHAWWNLRRLTSPEPPGEPLPHPVDVLIPARNEAGRIGATLTSVLAQRGVPGLHVTVLDDASTDGTAQAAAAAASGDPRLTIRTSHEEPPPGWLGKPYACHRLAATADAGSDGTAFLVFLDADVVLEPDGLAAATAALADSGADLASPWPRQLAVGAPARLLQPLQQWSWATTLPLDIAERSRRPSLAAANGQFLIVRRDSYRAIGGHAAVADCVLEDIELARAVKRAGGRALLLDGHRLASCQMYDTAAELRAGYRKSLWAAFGTRDAALPARVAAAAAAWSVLALAYLVPPLGLLLGPTAGTRALGAMGTVSAVANRALVAQRTGSPVWPDSLAQPASVALFIGLSIDSLAAHATGRTTWKGRSVRGGTGNG